MTELNDFMNTSEQDRKGEERNKLRIRNVSVFVVKRFHLLIQIKSILLFYGFFFFIFFFILVYILMIIYKKYVAQYYWKV